MRQLALGFPLRREPALEFFGECLIDDRTRFREFATDDWFAAQVEVAIDDPVSPHAQTAKAFKLGF